MWVQKGRQFYALIRRGEGQSQREYIRGSTGSSQHSSLMTQSEQTQGQMAPYTAHVNIWINDICMSISHMGQLHKFVHDKEKNEKSYITFNDSCSVPIKKKCFFFLFEFILI